MLLLRFLLIFAFLLTLTFARTPRKPDSEISVKPKCNRCALAYRCSPYWSEELQWYLEDNICRVFANGCMASSYNCSRINDCKTEIVKTTKEECQQKCASNCDSQPEEQQCAWIAALSPVGTSAGMEEQKSFRNRCEALQWECMNSRPIASLNPGVC